MIYWSLNSQKLQIALNLRFDLKNIDWLLFILSYKHRWTARNNRKKTTKFINSFLFSLPSSCSGCSHEKLRKKMLHRLRKEINEKRFPSQIYFSIRNFLSRFPFGWKTSHCESSFGNDSIVKMWFVLLGVVGELCHTFKGD
jgi:hypothetical protein